MPSLQIHQIPVLSDNYVYLIRDPETQATAAVDPSVAGPVLAALDRLGWTLTHILSTHHHHDHVGGNLELKRATGCTIVGNRADARAHPGTGYRRRGGRRGGARQPRSPRDRGIRPHRRPYRLLVPRLGGAVLRRHAVRARLRPAVRGDRRPDVVEPGQAARSSGRYPRLLRSRVHAGECRLRAEVDPDNGALRRRADRIRALRADNQPTVPSTLAEERATNPFLRADAEDLQRAASLPGGDPVDVFAEIRRRKDEF